MANEIQFGSLGTLQTYLSTALNALGDGANKLGAEIDNTINKKMFMNIKLFLPIQAGARSAGAYVALYFLGSVDDGVTFSYGTDAIDPAISSLKKTFPLDAVADERGIILEGVAIPAGKFKMLLINETGQAFAATLNTLSYQLYNVQVAS